MAERSELFHAIGSELIGVALQRFFALGLPRLLKKPRPSFREMKIIHRIIASYGSSRPPLSEEASRELIIQLTTRDHPLISDAGAALAAADVVDRHFESSIRENKMDWKGPANIEIALQNGTITRVSIEPRDLRFGHFRGYGSRRIDGGKREAIYASTAVSVSPRDSESESFESGYYVHLTKDLAAVFKLACAKYDAIQKEAQSLDERLKAIVMFQFLGKILHPFVDGNGRSFSAKLVLDLNTTGFPAREIPAFPEIHKELGENCLIGISPSYLSAFLKKHGLPLFKQEEFLSLLRDPQRYGAYMESLSQAIRKEIELGIVNDNKEMNEYLESGAFLLKVWLSKKVGERKKNQERFGPPRENRWYVSPQLYKKWLPILREQARKQAP